MRRSVLLFLLFFPSLLVADQSIEEMLYALELAEYWDKKNYERFPLTYNHILETGYFVTHSARMAEEGDMGVGLAHAPPYLNWNGRIQPYPFLAFSLNYRIFCGCEDTTLSQYGFGDYADRGANFKIALVTPEYSCYSLPGVAFGIDDFMGSKKFTTYYIVGTKVWRNAGMEASFGWGRGRYSDGPSLGFFGGANWFPLIRCSNKWIRGLCLSAEYDPTNYEDPEKEPHPEGRVTHSRLNVGAKYALCDILECSASYIRGEAFAFSGSLHYNWGKTTGFLPKIKDPAPYTAPVDREPLGCSRPASLMIQSMSYALDDQGFQLTKAWLGCSTLWLRVINRCYRHEQVVRMRLQKLLAALTPSNIDKVVVQIESYGIPCQQYVYHHDQLLRYAAHYVSAYEFDVVSPRTNACVCPPGDPIFRRRYELWRARLSPRIENFFGSASGKYKYDVGVKLDLEGFLPCNWFYEVQASTTLFSDLTRLSDYDIFFPSQLPNVATDYVRYRQSHAITWDRLYLQKSWNFGKGCFGRVAGGYFQVNYAGVAGEGLWYPAHKYFALGFEWAIVRKREYSGLGFQSKLRRFEGKEPIYFPYTTLQQYFFDFYLDFPDLQLVSKVSVGQFLAGDKGVRVELTRYFKNGMRITGWLTYTNAQDQIHERNYYDRGVGLEIPFDFFYRCSSRRVWSYAMGAWLRDAGYSIWTGRGLFESINQERR